MKTEKQVNEYRYELLDRWNKLQCRREMKEIDATGKMSMTAEMAHISAQMVLVDWVLLSDNVEE